MPEGRGGAHERSGRGSGEACVKRQGERVAPSWSGSTERLEEARRHGRDQDVHDGLLALGVTIPGARHADGDKRTRQRQGEREACGGVGWDALRERGAGR